MRTIIGIDPGKAGAICIWPAHGDPVVHKMPVGAADLYRTVFDAWLPATAYVEKVASMPQMSAKSAFTYGINFGMIQMACIAAGIRLEWVTPAKWQGRYSLKKAKRRAVNGSTTTVPDSTEKKRQHKVRAQELFPGITVTLKNCDALLIADYGRAMQREEARA